MRKAPRTKSPVSAATAIGDALAFHGVADEVRSQRVITEWSDLVGTKLAQRTRPEAIVDRVLLIEVASSAWMHELTLLKPQLLAGLVERLAEIATPVKQGYSDDRQT